MGARLLVQTFKILTEAWALVKTNFHPEGRFVLVCFGIDCWLCLQVSVAKYGGHVFAQLIGLFGQWPAIAHNGLSLF